MTTTSVILLPSVAHLYKLANYPVVIHVALHPSALPDYSAITSIRNSGWTFLQSENLQEAQDIALTAHALAIRSGKGVIHFFDSNRASKTASIAAENSDVVRDILNIDSVRRFQASVLPGSSIYADDGRVATVSDQPEQPARLNGVQPSDVDAVSSKEWSQASSKSSQPSVSGTPPSISSATTIEPPAPAVTSEDIFKYATAIWAALEQRVGRAYKAFEWIGPARAENSVFIFGSDVGLFSDAISNASPGESFANAGIIVPRLYRPWLGAKLIEAIPRSVKRVAVLEQISRRTTKWGPILLDVLTSIKSAAGGVETIVGHQLGYISEGTVQQALRGVFQNLTAERPIQNLEVGERERPEESQEYGLAKPKSETAYTKILDQLFGDRVYIANSLTSEHAGISNTISASPEYGFGSLLARKERRKTFVSEVKEAATSGSFLTNTPKRSLAQWVANAEDAKKADEVAEQVLSHLNIDNSTPARKLLANKAFFRKESLWLVGSDAWSYDLGNSGVHHILASGENVNLLIIDSTPTRSGRRPMRTGGRRILDSMP